METAQDVGEIRIAALEAADGAEALALSNTVDPHVPVTGEAAFQRLLGFANVALTARRGPDLLGFLIALPPGTKHDSPYYAWFCQRGGHFLYVDRIVVGAAARGLGIGRRLYAAAEAAAKSLAPPAPRICCEVNEVPPNPVSLAFHTALGFQEVGKVATSPQKRVVMLEKPLRP